MASMKSIRWGSVGTTLMLVATATGVYGITGSAHESQANASAIPSSPTAMATTTVATAVTTMTTTTTIPIPVPVVPVIALTADLAQGASGDEVLAVQNRLVELGFDPGKLDGSFGLAMRYAVEGFQKFQGLAATGVVNAEVVTALANGIAVSPLVEDGAAKRLEIDLTRQVLILWEEGNVRLISTISTGSGRKYCVNGSCQVARTPTGDFEFMWRYSGWRESRLGKLYNPVYFTAGGIAVHGSGSVPTHPASHGCIRIPMHIASYFPSLVAKGDPVHVVGESPPGPGGGTEYITVKPPPAPEPEVVPVPATIDPTSPTPTTITTVAPSPAQAPASQVPALSTPTVITPQPVVATPPPLP